MILAKQKIVQSDIDLLVNDRIKSNRLSEILFIVPTRRKIRYFTRELLSYSPGKAAFGLNIETLGSFSQKLISDFSGSKELISEEASVLLLELCFSEVKLKYFSQYTDHIPFGTLERIKNVISEYKKHGISPERLREESQTLDGTEKIKALDIAEVFEKYQTKLIEINSMETGDVYSGLIKLSLDEYEKIFRKFYPDVNLVLINGFDEFTIPETEIINNTADVHGLELFIILDYYRFNPLIFSHLDLCHDRFIRKGFFEVKDLSISEQTVFINTIKENLSLKSFPLRINKFSDKLTLITAANREEEIELIAKQIKVLLDSGSTEPDKICVVFNLIGKYSPIIRDRFAVYGIPFNLTDRFQLSNSEPVKGIIHHLEILENDFYYKSIIRSQSNYYLKIEDVNLAELIKTSVSLKIVSGLSTWLSRIHEAKQRIESGFNIDPENNNLVNRYNRAESDILKIKKSLEPFCKKLTPQEFNEGILSLIHGLNLPGKILNAPRELIEKNIKALSKFISSLNEFTGMLQLQFGKDAEFELKYFLNQLRTLTAFSRYNISEKPGYGVQVTTLNEIRGLKFDYVFICGLNDGDLPTRFSPEIFFSGSFAKEENRHQVEERYLFYQALCTFKKGLILSYPGFEEERELVRSGFLNDFLNLFGVQNKDLKSFSDTIFSQKELLEYIGKLPGERRASVKLPEGLNIDIKKINESIIIDDIRQQQPFGANEYTGFTGGKNADELKQLLGERVKREFSATRLEVYAKCPYKFFLENILGIETTEEPLEELEAFEYGSLIHSVLYEFYSNLSKKKIRLGNCSDKEFKEAEDMLFELAEKKFVELNVGSEASFIEREKLLGINGRRKDSLLYKFLEEERNYPDGYVPAFFELGFGRTKNNGDKMDAPGKEIKAGSIKLSGKIDRVDVNEDENIFRVIDYKLSGTAPTIEELKTGLSLQLPLYMYAAKEFISAQLGREIRPAGAEIYSLKYAEKDFGRKEIRIKRKTGEEQTKDKIQSAEQMIQICIEAVNRFVNQISLGKFNLSELPDRENKVCRYCDFKKICRIQEVD